LIVLLLSHNAIVQKDDNILKPIQVHVHPVTMKFLRGKDSAAAAAAATTTIIAAPSVFAISTQKRMLFVDRYPALIFTTETA